MMEETTTRERAWAHILTRVSCGFVFSIVLFQKTDWNASKCETSIDHWHSTTNTFKQVAGRMASHPLVHDSFYWQRHSLFRLRHVSQVRTTSTTKRKRRRRKHLNSMTKTKSEAAVGCFRSWNSFWRVDSSNKQFTLVAVRPRVAFYSEHSVYTYAGQLYTRPALDQKMPFGIIQFSFDSQLHQSKKWSRAPFSFSFSLFFARV